MRFLLFLALAPLWSGCADSCQVRPVLECDVECQNGVADGAGVKLICSEDLLK